MSENVLFALEDVDFIRGTLAAAHVYLHAQDMSEHQRKMMPPPIRPSSLTKEVAECLEMVEKEYASWLMAERERELYTVNDDEYEDEDGDDE